MQGCDYEVFLSFRGPDTRTGFTDHLYTRLTDAGVRTYRDDEELCVGEEIGPDLLGAIEQSKISIPIFSKNYASSKWCLKELAKMVECRKRKGQVIMPVFYYVEPSEVRYQTGDYGESLLVHGNKKRVDDETIRNWRAALNEVGGLKGWNVENVASRHEGQLVKEMVTTVLSELKTACLVVSDFLVGVDDRVKEVLGMIGTEIDDAKIVGIHGMGGIGKTTLAKVVYDKISRDFENRCFLADVKETSRSKGIECLQTQLISNLSRPGQGHPSINSKDEGIMTIEERFSTKKVLILLDDVDEKDQLTALLGRRGCFGLGSRILITTRNLNVLRAFKVKLTYLVGCLDPDRSLQLFSKHVFGRDHPPNEKMEQSREIVKIAEGLPLILEVMGSTLSICGQKEEMWDDYLVKWKKGHIKGIGNKLMISYETLDFGQRQIFLDIACLFDGYDYSAIKCMWRDCGFCPTEGLEVLRLMSLIKIGDDNKLWMHDQLKDLGREIVSQESGGQLNKQSRLWNHEEALKILLSEKRNAKLEALCLKFEKWSKYRFTLEGFAALPNLRFLHVDSASLSHDRVERFLSQATLLWHNKSPITSPTDFSPIENRLLPNLRWLSWHYFPRRILKLSNFPLTNLVVLDFSRSTITHDWDGWRHIKRAKKLKVLDLSRCEHLTKTPDFSGFPMLERLILKRCYKLTEVDSSIGQLKRLIFLNLRDCWNLHYLPDELGITELPESMESLENLKVLKLTRISALPKLPESLISLAIASHVPMADTDLSNLINLKLLLLDATAPEISSPSESAQVHKLWWIGRLSKLEVLTLGHQSITDLPPELGALPHLKTLQLLRCPALKCIPQIPSSVTKLHVVICPSLTTLDISNLKNLSEFFVFDSPAEDLYGRELSDSLEELLKAQIEAASKHKELTEVHGAWLPHWLAVHLSQFQSFIVLHWNVHGKPVMNIIIQKISQSAKWAEPHLETMKMEWIAALKEHYLTVETSFKRHLHSLATKTLEVCESSKSALAPHLINVKEVDDPYYQVDKI
ncbi:disease resistance protein L6-like [Rhodamnia argentea]|uniref:Disease resistance protein L6-like n=1 Tax=Rhodamnia argentea TaxID=178133 RepID=A0ABM3HBV7_9MYRT|nr:disease resistance protein L6-like [Rhodamnia argentea]